MNFSTKSSLVGRCGEGAKLFRRTSGKLVNSEIRIRGPKTGGDFQKVYVAT